jgi:hypothetical protein
LGAPPTRGGWEGVGDKKPKKKNKTKFKKKEIGGIVIII